jgi:hypothetical protein
MVPIDVAAASHFPLVGACRRHQGRGPRVRAGWRALRPISTSRPPSFRYCTSAHRAPYRARDAVMAPCKRELGARYHGHRFDRAPSRRSFYRRINALSKDPS